MVKQFSEKFHIVLAPSKLLNPNTLVAYLQKREALRYVVAIEKGKGGHLHIDAFVVFADSLRQDHFRRDVMKLYPSIPEEEKRNCKVFVNSRDPDERYGFGYSLKECGELITNLDFEYQEECTKYYQEHKEKIELATRRANDTKVSVDSIARGLVDFVTCYLDGEPFESLGSCSWLIDEYMKSIRHKIINNYSVVSKLSEEKLEKYLKWNLGANLLTSTQVNFNEKENNPLI